MKSILLFIWETVKIVIIALLIVLPIRYFVFQPFIVRGQSMEPSFSHGDYLIIDQITYRFNQPQRGEVIVFRYPNNPAQRYIKRIIALPGETVEINEGRVVIYNDQYREGTALEENHYLFEPAYTVGELRMTMGEKEYFVLGDNRDASADSRRWGTVPEHDIIGRALIRLWPLVAFATIEAPQY